MSFLKDFKEEISRQEKEELPNFIDRWSPHHEGGKVRYILTQMVFLGTAYFLLFVFVLPLIQQGGPGVDENMQVIAQFSISALLGYGTSYILSTYLWNHNERRFTRSDRIKNRYNAAWTEDEPPEKDLPEKAPAKKKGRR